MICRKCKTKCSKGSKTCPKCGELIVKSKKPLWISVAVLAIAIMIITGLIAYSYYNAPVITGRESEPANQKSLTPGVDIQNPTVDETLDIQIDDERACVGKESTVYFRVVAPKDYGSIEIVRSDNNLKISTLVPTVEKANGYFEYCGEYTFTPSNTDKIYIHAVAGDKISKETYIKIYDPVSSEELEEYHNLVCELGEYSSTLDFSYSSIDEELDTIENWLESNSSVSEVKKEGDELIFTTNSGISAFYYAGYDNRFVAAQDSKTDDFEENTTAVEYYKSWEKNQNSLRQADGDISYLPADITVTNDNVLFLYPTTSANDGFDNRFFSEFTSNIAASTKLNSRIDVRDDPYSTMDAIVNRDLINYGSVYLGAHGGIDGNNDYFFGVYSSQNGNDWRNFVNRYQNLIAKTNTSDWHFMHGISVTTETDSQGNQVSVTHYKARLSSRYFQERYRGYNFDNTFLFMTSCHGASDEDFNEFLFEHNIQAMIGSEESIRFGTVCGIYNEVMLPAYINTDNEKSKIKYLWNKYVQNGTSGFVYETFSAANGEVLSFGEYFEEYRKQVPQSDWESESDILADCINGNVITIDRLTQYFNWIYEGRCIDLQITPYAVNSQNAFGMSRSSGTFDYSYKYNDEIELITKDDKDFSFGGTGEISGTLYKGKTIRTVKPSGEYTEVSKKGEVLANANVVANRFLNQRYVEVGETVSAKNGIFKFKSDNDYEIPWGHYVITSDYSSYEGETSIILTKDAVNGGEFVVRGGNAKISGYIEGKKSATDNSVITLGDADIKLESGNGNVKTANSANDGSFEFENLTPGIYTMTVTKDKYEEYVDTFKIETGYEYVYEKGNFVLEYSGSTKDVVLVLDVSSSMSGEPLKSTKESAIRFADTVLGKDKGYRVSLVTFSSDAQTKCNFTKYNNKINPVISELSIEGNTNTESGLRVAHDMLSKMESKEKIIVLMSDGQPNLGKRDKELVDYAQTIKDDGVIIYTIGFFVGINDLNLREECKNLMRDIASHGYHYEGGSIRELSDFFDDMARQASGELYDHVTVACPVDVRVNYNGETLSSAKDSLCTRTSFGTLMLDGPEDDPIKVLRLKSGVNYNIEIIGTGDGTMDYSISYADSKGNYNDTRTFENIKINPDFRAVSSTKKESDTTMRIDENGDGTADIIMTTDKNGNQSSNTVMGLTMRTVYIAFGIMVLIALIIFAIHFKRNIYPQMKMRTKDSASTLLISGDVENVNPTHESASCATGATLTGNDKENSDVTKDHSTVSMDPSIEMFYTPSSQIECDDFIVGENSENMASTDTFDDIKAYSPEIIRTENESSTFVLPSAFEGEESGVHEKSDVKADSITVNEALTFDGEKAAVVKEIAEKAEIITNAEAFSSESKTTEKVETMALGAESVTGEPIFTNSHDVSDNKETSILNTDTTSINDFAEKSPDSSPVSHDSISKVDTAMSGIKPAHVSGLKKSASFSRTTREKVDGFSMPTSFAVAKDDFGTDADKRQVVSTPVFCSSCGCKHNPESKFCTQCGTKLN